MNEEPLATPAHPRRSETVSELDLQGLRCPLPVLRTRKALARLRPGQMLRVISTDPLAGLDIPHLVGETGNDLLRVDQSGASRSFTIRKR